MKRLLIYDQAISDAGLSIVGGPGILKTLEIKVNGRCHYDSISNVACCHDVDESTLPNPLPKYLSVTDDECPFFDIKKVRRLK